MGASGGGEVSGEGTWECMVDDNAYEGCRKVKGREARRCKEVGTGRKVHDGREA